MRAEEEKKGKGNKKRNEKENGDQNRLFLFCFFISSRACFFICSVVVFRIIKKTVSRLSRSYPLLFAIKISTETCKDQICTPTLIFATFSNISGRPKDMAMVV